MNMPEIITKEFEMRRNIGGVLTVECPAFPSVPLELLNSMGVHAFVNCITANQRK